MKTIKQRTQVTGCFQTKRRASGWWGRFISSNTKPGQVESRPYFSMQNVELEAGQGAGGRAA